MWDRLVCWEFADARTERRWKTVILILPFVILAAFLALKIRWPGYYHRYAVREDGPGEYLTAVFFLLATVYFFLSWRASRSLESHLVPLLYLAAAVGCFLVFGEEISWGQRILGVGTPGWLEEINRQDEINLHNLDAVQGNLIYAALSLSFLGAFGWALFASLPRPARDRLTRAGLRRFIPDWFLSSYFFVLFLVYSAITYLREHLNALLGTGMTGGPFFGSGDQEPAELILALGVLLFAGFSYSTLRRESRERSS